MTSPVTLNTPVLIYQKGATINWLTDNMSKSAVQLTTSKNQANVWVIQRVGMHYTIKVNERNQYLAYGSPRSGVDCSVKLTSNTRGKDVLWDIVQSSTGVKIKTIEPCYEKGKKTIQYLKVSGGSRLELSSRDSDYFFIVLANPGKTAGGPKPRPPVPGPTTPAPVESVPIKIYTASQIHKITTVEPVMKPHYYLTPRMYKLPHTSNVDGILTVTPTRTLWYTRPSGKRVSFHTTELGPHMAINPSCTGLVMNSGAISPRAQFSVGFVTGAPGNIIRIEGDTCANNKPRYLILEGGEKVGLTSRHPTKQTLNMYLWRFLGTTPPVTTPPPPIPDPVTTPAPPLVTTPGPNPWDNTYNNNQNNNQDININIQDTDGRRYRDPRVVFPLPVTPDLLIGMNPDGTLDATGSLLTPTPTPQDVTGAATDVTVSPGNEFPLPSDDEDMMVPGMDGPDGPYDGGYLMDAPEEDSGSNWSMTSIAALVAVLAVIGFGGYYLYKSYYGGGSSNTGGNAGQFNTVNIPTNAGTNTNFGNLGNTTGTNTGGSNTFADGFNDFANVENIGPPPPTTR